MQPMRPASKFIHEVPPVEVEGRIAVCDGGRLLNFSTNVGRTFGTPKSVHQP